MVLAQLPYYPQKKFEAVTQSGVRGIDHPTWRRTQGAGIIKGWEDIQGLSPLQFRFRRFRSTADALRLEHDISAAFENGKFVFAVFFDLQKPLIPRGNVESCVNYFPLIFVDIYLSSSEIC